QAGMSRQGIDPAKLDWDYQRLSDELRPAALRAVRWALLQEAIAEKEEGAVSEADVDAEGGRLAREAGRAGAQIRGMLQKSGDLDQLRLNLRERKVVNLLIEHAQVQPDA